MRQPLDIASGQQLHGLPAHRDGGAGFNAIPAVKQLQAEAFRQVARTDACRLHVLQQLQGNGELLLQLPGLLRVVVCQAGSERCQAVFQVAVVVERLDQEVQGGAIQVRKTQAERLPVQMILQRLVGAGQVGGFGVAVIQVVLARWRVTAPFAVIRR